jgi:hypothetical protein
MLMNQILLRYQYPPIIIRKKNRAAYLDRLHVADSIPLTENDPKKYTVLVDFAAGEMIENYWNLFL